MSEFPHVFRNAPAPDGENPFAAEFGSGFQIEIIGSTNHPSSVLKKNFGVSFLDGVEVVPTVYSARPSPYIYSLTSNGFDPDDLTLVRRVFRFNIYPSTAFDDGFLVDLPPKSLIRVFSFGWAPPPSWGGAWDPDTADYYVNISNLAHPSKEYLAPTVISPESTLDANYPTGPSSNKISSNAHFLEIDPFALTRQEPFAKFTL